MGSSKEQIAAFQRRLVAVQKLKEQAEKSKKETEKAKKEAEVARGEDEQHGYNVRVAETEESLRAKVPAVYQAYCAQTWSEALNRAGVEATSDLRKPENIFYPPTIQASAPPSSYDDVASTVADPTKEAQPQDPPPPSQQELAKEPEVPEDALSNVEKPLEKTTEFPQDRAVS